MISVCNRLVIIISGFILMVGSSCAPDGLDLPDTLNTSQPVRENEQILITENDSVPQRELPRDSLTMYKLVKDKIGNTKLEIRN